MFAIASRLKRAGFSYQSQCGQPPTPDRFGAERGYETLPLPLPEGGALRGFVRAPKEASDARWLLFFPGNACTQLAESLDLLERLRAGRDLGIAVWSYRSFEGSDGLPSPAAAAHDAKAECALLAARHGVRSDRLILAGYSMGSGIALRLASELDAEARAPRGLLLLSPFSLLTVAPPERLARLKAPHRYETDDVAGRYGSPTLVLAGAADEALPVAKHARPLVAKLPGTARYIELPGMGHVDYLSDAQLLSPCIDFITSC